MTLDVRGSLKNTRLNPNVRTFISESVSNSVDAFLIHSPSDPKNRPLKITIEVSVCCDDDNLHDLNYQITDNGAGFNQERIDAFCTKDTTYKDDLNVEGLGECKGSGRVQYFHLFKKVEIITTSDDRGVSRSFSFKYEHPQKFITPDNFEPTQLHRERGSKVSMSSADINKFNRLVKRKDLKKFFSAKAVKEYLIISFLDRFLSIKSLIGDFQIEINSDCGGEISTALLKNSDLPAQENKETFPICAKISDDEYSDFCMKFEVTHYLLPKEEFPKIGNKIYLSAKSAPVEEITKEYIYKSSVDKPTQDGNFHLVYISSPYLDTNVNEVRDGFIFPKKFFHNLFSAQQITREEIVEGLENYIVSIVKPSDWTREKVFAQAEKNYGISEKLIEFTNVKIPSGDSAERVVKRVLKVLQVKAVEDTSKIMDLRDNLINAEPTDTNYLKKMNDFSWQYAASLKPVDMASLSQLVVRRVAVLDVLRHAMKKDLAVQRRREKLGQISQNEVILHNIFFPRYQDTESASQHDIWILDEEYQYYDYICSDKSLASIDWNGTKLFDSDVDEKLEEAAKGISSDRSSDRPDIAIFSEEGTAVIIEFKAPGVDLSKHTSDLIQYSKILGAKSRGRITRVYGYLVGDTIDDIKVSWPPFADRNGHFTYENLDVGREFPIISLYAEMLTYDHILKRAEKRIKVYKDKLDI